MKWLCSLIHQAKHAKDAKDIRNGRIAKYFYITTIAIAIIWKCGVNGRYFAISGVFAFLWPSYSHSSSSTIGCLDHRKRGYSCKNRRKILKKLPNKCIKNVQVLFILNCILLVYLSFLNKCLNSVVRSSFLIILWVYLRSFSLHYIHIYFCLFITVGF